MLTLVSAINFSRFTPRKYIVTEGDHLSAQKAAALELLKSDGASKTVGFLILPIDFPFHNHVKQAIPNIKHYTVLTIPRARRVHQSLLSTPPSAVLSLATCLHHVMVAPMLLPKGNTSGFADVLLINGPGTCFVLCIAVYVNKVGLWRLGRSPPQHLTTYTVPRTAGSQDNLC